MSDTSVLSPVAKTGTVANEDQIIDWLRQYIGDVLALPEDEIDIDASFQQLGLDSSAAVGMTGDLADWLGRDIDAAAAYDHPTIRGLAKALVS
ncbi:acyl carrier protein [Parachitinimonas caeni]|uniref:Acyl carrier protein n=1 Tax=Parachitinimonas caeni TaxID=3031301 RepID=A0ABT7DRR9_9NEIS|nr:acyl carrier protein [Parachitinimonas caeni]MDK2122758.1 acyl carrier protein [Parachitinimonas caeni]